MIDSFDVLAGPPLPGWFLFLNTVTFAALVLYVIARTKSRAGRFLLFACWFRYTLSSLHEYTYREAIGGLSWIALGSILTIVAGLLLLEKRRFFTPALAPVALVCGSILLSAILNHDPAASLEPILRFLYFAVVCVAAWQALETIGASIFRRLLVLFIPVAVAQIGSIVLGVAKSGEIDGSTSYIGGFYHEQIFSLILAGCFLVAVLTPSIGRATRIALGVICLVGVYLANYRTTILALVPLAATAIFLSVPRSFNARQRGLALLFVLLVGGAVIVVTPTAMEDRFSDLRVAATEGTSLIKPPESFRPDERRVLSSRPYIWSGYIYAYKKAPPVQRWIGFGPDSWVGNFPQYAHNTLVSFLYEMGIIGVASILLLWATMFRFALLAEPPIRGLLMAAHASFFILNMATMPHSQIEGGILYGVLCGYTLAKARVARARSRAEVSRSGRRAGSRPSRVGSPARAQVR